MTFHNLDLSDYVLMVFNLFFHTPYFWEIEIGSKNLLKFRFNSFWQEYFILIVMYFILHYIRRNTQFSTLVMPHWSVGSGNVSLISSIYTLHQLSTNSFCSHWWPLPRIHYFIRSCKIVIFLISATFLNLLAEIIL